MPSLPPAPRSLVDDSGAPRFGTYQGSMDVVDLARLRGPAAPQFLESFAMHKRWHYSFVATPELSLLSAIVDVGYASNAFVMLLDMASGRVVADHGVLGLAKVSAHVNAQPGAGFDARFSRPDVRLAVERPFGADGYSGSVRVGLPLVTPKVKARWQLLVEGGPPALTVVAPVQGGIVNVTQKWAGLLASGVVEADGRRWSLDGGVGGLDLTIGYLARRTAWRWALVCGRLDDGTPFGINLVEGFNESRDDVNENAVWVGRELFPVGRARFQWNATAPLDPWEVKTTDGALELKFAPFAMHREKRELVLASSDFKQPVGLWEGVMRIGGQERRFRGAPGVAEDQSVVW